MELVNLTPHPVSIQPVDGPVFELPTAGPPARVVVSLDDLGTITTGGLQVRVTRTPSEGDVVGLPEPVQGRYLVVSRVVASACPHRDDLLFPDELIRDQDGKVIGCAALSSFGPGAPASDH